MKMFIAVVVVAFAAGPGCMTAFADGGQVRASERHDDYQMTIFTSPNPLRAGPIDVSVLVQRVDSGEVITDADVLVEATSSDPALPPIRIVATSTAATNKLLSAAVFDLPAAGSWDVCVAITPPRQPARNMRFTVDAAPPLPAWLTVCPWFTWPFAAALIFAVHRTLVARREARYVSQDFGSWGVAG